MTTRKKRGAKKKAAKKTVRRRAAVEPITLTALLQGALEYARAVQAGADPIEAIHGHICRPGCIHDTSMLRSKHGLRWSLTTWDATGAVVDAINRPIASSLDHALRDAERNDRVVRAEATGRGGTYSLEQYERRDGILCRL